MVFSLAVARIGLWLERETEQSLRRPSYSGPPGISKWCAYCGVELSDANHNQWHATARTRDHIVPRSDKSRGEQPNLVDTCAACNMDKAAMSLLVYLLRYKLMAPRKHHVWLQDKEFGRRSRTAQLSRKRKSELRRQAQIQSTTTPEGKQLEALLAERATVQEQIDKACDRYSEALKSRTRNADARLVPPVVAVPEAYTRRAEIQRQIDALCITITKK